MAGVVTVITLAAVLIPLSSAASDNDDELATCQDLVKVAEERSDFELAAICRSRFPEGTCRTAWRDLGPRPWSSDVVDASCASWQPALESLGSPRDLQNVVRALKKQHHAPINLNNLLGPNKRSKNVDKTVTTKTTTTMEGATNLDSTTTSKPSTTTYNWRDDPEWAGGAFPEPEPELDGSTVQPADFLPDGSIHKEATPGSQPKDAIVPIPEPTTRKPTSRTHHHTRIHRAVHNVAKEDPRVLHNGDNKKGSDDKATTRRPKPPNPFKFPVPPKDKATTRRPKPPPFQFPVPPKNEASTKRPGPPNPFELPEPQKSKKQKQPEWPMVEPKRGFTNAWEDTVTHRQTKRTTVGGHWLSLMLASAAVVAAGALIVRGVRRVTGREMNGQSLIATSAEEEAAEEQQFLLGLE